MTSYSLLWNAFIVRKPSIFEKKPCLLKKSLKSKKVKKVRNYMQKCNLYQHFLI